MMIPVEPLIGRIDAERLSSPKETNESLKAWLDSLSTTYLSFCDERDRTLIDIAAAREYDGLQLVKYIEKLWSKRGIRLTSTNALFYAARAGNFDICSYLVGRDCDVNVVNQLGRTPLFDALSSDSPRRFITAEKLIKASADVHHRDENRQTPLFCAAQCVHSADGIALLLKERADPDAVDVDGRNAIFDAAAANNDSSVRVLARAKANVHRVDRCRTNALRSAIKRTSAKTAMTLLAEFAIGLPPIEAMRNFRDEHGDGKCIDMARDRGLLEIVEYLDSMKRCYKVAREGSRDELEEAVCSHPGGLGFNAYGRSLLHEVASRKASSCPVQNMFAGTWTVIVSGQVWGKAHVSPSECFFTVKDSSSNENYRLPFKIEGDGTSSSPFVMSEGDGTSSSDFDIAEARLVDHSSVGIREWRLCNGSLSVWRLVEPARDDVLQHWELLVTDWHWNVNMVDSTGATPLSIAAQMGNSVSVRFLLEARADVNIKDCCGYSPLYCAVRGGNAELAVVKALSSKMSAKCLDEALRQVWADKKREASTSSDVIASVPKRRASAISVLKCDADDDKASVSKSDLSGKI